MNCTVGFVSCFLRVSLACLGSMAQGSWAGTSVELWDNSFQTSLYNSFGLLVVAKLILKHHSQRVWTRALFKKIELPRAMPSNVLSVGVSWIWYYNNSWIRSRLHGTLALSCCRQSWPDGVLILVLLYIVSPMSYKNSQISLRIVSDDCFLPTKITSTLVKLNNNRGFPEQ